MPPSCPAKELTKNQPLQTGSWHKPTGWVVGPVSQHTLGSAPSEHLSSSAPTSKCLPQTPTPVVFLLPQCPAGCAVCCLSLRAWISCLQPEVAHWCALQMLCRLGWRCEPAPQLCLFSGHPLAEAVPRGYATSPVVGDGFLGCGTAEQFFSHLRLSAGSEMQLVQSVDCWALLSGTCGAVSTLQFLSC